MFKTAALINGDASTSRHPASRIVDGCARLTSFRATAPGIQHGTDVAAIGVGHQLGGITPMREFRFEITDQTTSSR
jgi:hypothetical protein